MRSDLGWRRWCSWCRASSADSSSPNCSRASSRLSSVTLPAPSCGCKPVPSASCSPCTLRACLCPYRRWWSSAGCSYARLERRDKSRCHRRCAGRSCTSAHRSESTNCCMVRTATHQSDRSNRRLHRTRTGKECSVSYRTRTHCRSACESSSLSSLCRPRTRRNCLSRRRACTTNTRAAPGRTHRRKIRNDAWFRHINSCMAAQADEGKVYERSEIKAIEPPRRSAHLSN